MSIELNLKQAQEIVDFFGGDEESTVTVNDSHDGHSGPGLYVFLSEEPGEGSVFLES